MLLTTKVAAAVYIADFELFILETHAYWYWQGHEIVCRPRARWARA